MKYVLALSSLALAMTLAGCGGDSSSSGTSYSAKITLGNGNVYTCPSEAKKNACDSDSSCMAAGCDLTKKVVEPAPQTDAQCEVDGTTVYGQLGKTCVVTLDKLNGGAETELSCSSSGVLTLGNGLTVTSGSFNLNGYLLTCNK